MRDSSHVTLITSKRECVLRLHEGIGWPCIDTMVLSMFVRAPAVMPVMKLSLDPSMSTRLDITAESFALASWYDSQPAVRRLWGIKDADKLRVIVAVEPTHDNDDAYPVWFANTQAWASELRLSTGRHVQLELVGEPPCDGIEVDAGSVLIADLYWRDATLNRPYEVL